MILDEASVTVMVSDMTMMMRVCCSLTKAGTSCTADYIYIAQQLILLKKHIMKVAIYYVPRNKKVLTQFPVTQTKP